MKRYRILFVFAWLALLPAGCGGDDPAGKAGSGTVRGIDAAAGRVTLEHGDIPGLMKAMTMDFDLADPGLLDALEEGDEVDFRVRYAGGKYTVTEIRPK